MSEDIVLTPESLGIQVFDQQTKGQTAGEEGDITGP